MKTSEYLQSASARIIPLAVPNGRYQTGKQTLKPTELRTERHIFLLSSPLRCKIEQHGDLWIASNTDFDIEVPANTRLEAEQLFAEAFEELYEFFVKMPHASVISGVWAKRALFQDLIQAVYER